MCGRCLAAYAAKHQLVLYKVKPTSFFVLPLFCGIASLRLCATALHVSLLLQSVHRHRQLRRIENPPFEFQVHHLIGDSKPATHQLHRAEFFLRSL
jgi:hypothetical protein